MGEGDNILKDFRQKPDPKGFAQEIFGKNSKKFRRSFFVKELALTIVSGLILAGIALWLRSRLGLSDRTMAVLWFSLLGLALGFCVYSFYRYAKATAENDDGI